MSTTWVFLGLLAGREIAIRYVIELMREPSDVRRAPGWHAAGQGLNALLIALIVGLVGTFGYISLSGGDVDALPWLIPAAAGAMALAAVTRSYVAYRETAPGQLTLREAFGDIGKDLAKVTFGLIISIALVYLMIWILPGLTLG